MRLPNFLTKKQQAERNAVEAHDIDSSRRIEKEQDKIEKELRQLQVEVTLNRLRKRRPNSAQ